MGNLGEGQARAFLGHEAVGGRAEELVVQCPQEAFVVHGAGGEGQIDFWVAFYGIIITVGRLLRSGWTHYRWEGRPSRRP
jgi:hypothetical protein